MRDLPIEPEWHDHAQPFKGAVGGWKPRELCKVNKSFGRFECLCGNEWGSAHSLRKFKQACKKCEYYTLPCCLWINKNRKKLP